MKLLLRKSLVLLCLLALVRCSHLSSSTRAKEKPSYDRLLAMEIQLKDQAHEIAKLKSLVGQLSPKSTAKTQEATLGTLMNGQKSVDRNKEVPTTKLMPPERIKETTESVAQSDSPLIDSAETIADSSQELMQTYYRGVQLLEGQKYEEAIDTLKAFLRQNPDHVYADRAQFLIVDSHFRNKDYNMTIIESQGFEDKFPYSFKMPETLYRRGVSLVQLKQVDRARMTFDQLVKEYPKDPLAQMAQKKWASLQSGLNSQIR